MVNMQKQLPKILLEATLTPNDRAAIMGGRTDKHQKNEGDPLKIRLVQKTEKDGWPIVVIEEADGEDSMGAPRWREGTLPTPIMIALLVREQRKAEYSEAVAQYTGEAEIDAIASRVFDEIMRERVNIFDALPIGTVRIDSHKLKDTIRDAIAHMISQNPPNDI